MKTTKMILRRKSFLCVAAFAAVAIATFSNGSARAAQTLVYSDFLKELSRV